MAPLKKTTEMESPQTMSLVASSMSRDSTNLSSFQDFDSKSGNFFGFELEPKRSILKLIRENGDLSPKFVFPVPVEDFFRCFRHFRSIQPSPDSNRSSRWWDWRRRKHRKRRRRRGWQNRRKETPTYWSIRKKIYWKQKMLNTKVNNENIIYNWWLLWGLHCTEEAFSLPTQQHRVWISAPQWFFSLRCLVCEQHWVSNLSSAKHWISQMH